MYIGQHMRLWYLQPPLTVNVHAGVFRGARGLIIGLNLSSFSPFLSMREAGGSGETARMRRLV